MTIACVYKSYLLIYVITIFVIVEFFYIKVIGVNSGVKSLVHIT